MHRKLESVGEKVLEWEPCPSRGWAPSIPVEHPRRRGRNDVPAIRVGVNMLQFCSVSISPHTFWVWGEIFCMHLHIQQYLKFPKASGLEPYHHVILRHIRGTRCEKSGPSAKMQSVYSSPPADWASWRQNLQTGRLRSSVIWFFRCTSQHRNKPTKH